MRVSPRRCFTPSLSLILTLHETAMPPPVWQNSSRSLIFRRSLRLSNLRIFLSTSAPGFPSSTLSRSLSLLSLSRPKTCLTKHKINSPKLSAHVLTIPALCLLPIYRARRHEATTARKSAETVAFHEVLSFRRLAAAREVLPLRDSVTTRMRARTSNAHTPLSPLVLTHGLLAATRHLHARCCLVAHSREILMSHGQEGENKQIQPVNIIWDFRIVCQPSRVDKARGEEREIPRYKIYQKNHSKTRNNSSQLPKTKSAVSNENSYMVTLKTYNGLPKELQSLYGNKSNRKYTS